MQDQTNIDIIKEIFREFNAGNVPGVLKHFDQEIEWVRPGAPEIPFAGTFKGFQEVGRMFRLVNENIRVRSFDPGKLFSNEDSVVVLGTDTVDVIPTGKTYTTDSVQVFKFRDKKIIHVQAYIDTLMIYKTFQP